MTTETNDTIETYAISGVGPYAFSYRIFDEDDLTVTALEAGDLDPVPLTVNSHFTVSGANDEDGGSITLTSGAAATYAGFTLDIRSNTPVEQPTSIKNQGTFAPVVHEKAFDRLSRQIQDTNRRLNQKFGYPDNVDLNATMTNRTSWAAKYLYVNADGEIEPATSIGNTALTQSAVGAVLYPRTAAEIAASVTPTDYSYVPGHILRYYSGSGNYIAAIQAAINSGHKVYVPNGTYQVANLLMKTGLHIVGESHLAILQLVSGATTASYNGGVIDSGSRYPGNIICSTLDHDGGAYNDGGTRALDEENDEYIFENVTIENLTLDGNKANNAVGDLGENASAMGACVSIHQCRNVKVKNCRLINARLDGVHIGYSLHGGSDHCTVEDCWFEGNQRTNIAQVTGKHNTFHNNHGTAPTGGTGVTVGPGIDIEANLTGEVNFRHTVTGNHIGGSLSIVCGNIAKLWGTQCSGNTWTGQLKLYGSGQTDGCVIDGDVFVGDGENWLFRAGENTAGTSDEPALITNCTVTGYVNVMDDVAGCVDNLRVEGNTFHTEAFGELTRGYKVTFKGNHFYFSGNAENDNIYLSNTLAATVPNQGKIRFIGNHFYGTSNDYFLRINRDTSWTLAADDYVFKDNEVHCTGMTYMFSAPSSMTAEDNKFFAWKPIDIGSLSQFRLINNTIKAASAENLFANQSGTYANVLIDGNTTTNVTFNPIRPKDSTITRNYIIEGYISIVYSFTSAGVGRSLVSHNTLVSTSGIANVFVVTTGSGFSTGDFAADDQYLYNVYTGFAGGASIAGGMAGAYGGAFD